jgi:hypothetical protein
MSDLEQVNANDIVWIKQSLNRIEKQTTTTNGKVKKLTMALIAVAAFSLGLGLVEAQHLLTLLV